MRFSRRSVALSLTLGMAFGVAGCGSDDEVTTTTVADTLPMIATTTTSTTAVATTTTAAPTTTIAPSTTVAPTTTAATTTVPPPTTTIMPAGASISLDDDGIGDAVFGEDPDDVVSYLNDIIGGPDDDSGWVDAISRTCPGTQVRFVRWGDLTLSFGDDTSVASDRRHFFAWSFGPPTEVAPVPAGLATSTGISIGSSVAEVGRVYPGASLFDGDELAAASIHINDNLFAFVTSIEDSGVVLAMLGGQGCGE